MAAACSLCGYIFAQRATQRSVLRQRHFSRRLDLRTLTLCLCFFEQKNYPSTTAMLLQNDDGEVNAHWDRTG